MCVCDILFIYPGADNDSRCASALCFSIYDLSPGALKIRGAASNQHTEALPSPALPYGPKKRKKEEESKGNFKEIDLRQGGPGPSSSASSPPNSEVRYWVPPPLLLPRSTERPYTYRIGRLFWVVIQFLVKSIRDWIGALLDCALAVLGISFTAITVTTTPAKPKQKTKEKAKKALRLLQQQVPKTGPECKEIGDVEDGRSLRCGGFEQRTARYYTALQCFPSLYIISPPTVQHYGTVRAFVCSFNQSKFLLGYQLCA